jgi:FkbM family methyltransferase
MDLTGSTVLDIGGHVGTFAFKAKTRGASVVHSYEPEEPTVTYLERNLARLGGCTVHREAVGALIGWWFRSGKSVDKSPPTIDLDTAILRASKESSNGRIKLLKLDCERGEWPALYGATRLDLVDTIVGEWHRGEWNGKLWGPEDLPALLEPHGFNVFYGEGHTACGLFSAERREAEEGTPVRLPPVFVIYCNELPEKQRVMESQLSAAGIEPTWFASVHGSTWGLEVSAKATAGLSLGYYALWSHLWHSGISEALILEDDTVLAPNFHQRLLKIKRQLPQTWQFVYLGNLGADKIEERITERFHAPKGEGIVRMKAPYGTHAVLVRRSALPVLLKHCKNSFNPIDCQIWDTVLNPIGPNGCLLDWYSCFPALATQRGRI